MQHIAAGLTEINAYKISFERDIIENGHNNRRLGDNSDNKHLSLD